MLGDEEGVSLIVNLEHRWHTREGRHCVGASVAGQHTRTIADCNLKAGRDWCAAVAALLGDPRSRLMRSFYKLNLSLHSHFTAAKGMATLSETSGKEIR